MEGMSTWERLLSTDVFTCATCKKILCTPVWLTPSEKNICNTCYEENPEKVARAIKNATLNQILEELSFPCEYSKRGCEQVVKYLDYHEHVSKCAYNQPCVFNTCGWGGSNHQLGLHLCDDHPESVIPEENGAFPMRCTSATLDAINLAQTKDGRFITRIWRHLNAIHVVLYSNDQWNSSMGEFLLQYRTNTSTVTQVECRVCDHVSCLSTSPVNCFTKINVEPELELQSMQLVYKSQDNKPIVPKKFLPYFVCFQCNHFITTQRYECRKGHQMCEQCAKSHECVDGEYDDHDNEEKDVRDSVLKVIDTYNIKCSDCPRYICSLWEVSSEEYLCSNCKNGCDGNDNLVEVKRCYVPHDLIGEFAFPCRFEALGCKFMGPVPRNHENHCDYMGVFCPKAGCNFLNRYCRLLVHAIEEHKDSFIVQNRHEFNMSLEEGIKLQSFLICYEKLFIHTFKYAKSACQLVVSEAWDTYNKDFMFNIHIRGRLNTFNMTLSCGNVIPLSGDILRSLVNNDQVQYSVMVTRVNST